MNKITKEDIRVRYKEYNRLYFDNQLKHCKFSVQKMSWCEGVYTYKKEKDGIIEVKFMSGGKADITMAKQHDTEWFTETYNYAYYGNTLRFSRSGSNFSLTIEGYLFPELYLRDSFGCYTIAKRRIED